MNPYEELANAIVLQAVKDYVPYYKKLKEYREYNTNGLSPEGLKKYNRELKKREREFQEIVDFFHSAWFATLTNVNPELILAKLEAEVASI